MLKSSLRARPWAVLALAAAALTGCGGAGSAHPGGAGNAAGGARSRPPASGTAGAGRPAAPARLRATVIGRLPAPVQLPAVAVRGASALLAGGLDSADASVSSVVRVTGHRARVDGSLPRALHDLGAATLGTETYVFGGGDAGATSDQVVRLVAGGQAQPAGRLPVGASDVQAVALGGTAYVIGGYTGTRPLATIVAFTPGRPPRVAGRLPRPLRYAAVSAAGGRIIIAGGTSGTTARREILSFDPATGRVSKLGLLPAPLTHAAAATLGGRVFIVGGRGADLASQTSSILALDPATGSLDRAGRLPQPLSDTGAATLGGRILVFGGRDPAGQVHDGILGLTPETAAPKALKPAGLAPGRVPPLLDPANVYAAEAPGRFSPVTADVPSRIYVPNSGSNTVDEISPRTFKIIRHFAVGQLPQHVTPSWDLRTLWVSDDQGNDLTPIDPVTGAPGKPVPVADPYNLYFTPDGTRAIVVAEAQRALDFRDPQTMALRHRLSVPTCAGVDHMDMTADGRLALVSCEFSGRMIVVDLREERVVRSIPLTPGSMPQDVKLSPDGRTFYVADMARGGVWLIDGQARRREGFVRTGAGAHGLYPSRDARRLFVSDRQAGQITVISFRTRRPVARWRLPGRTSPDMGGVSADGRVLWLSGRYDGEVYAISTVTGRLLHRIPVGSGPHGLCVWPQPGRYSLGHTGILR